METDRTWANIFYSKWGSLISRMILKCDICLSCEILFSHLSGKLRRILNTCITGAFWILLLVDYYCWINVFPSYSILLNLLFKLLFSAIKAKKYKARLEWRILLHRYSLLKDFHHRKVETLLMRQITYKEDKVERHVIHSCSFILFCHITILTMKTLLLLYWIFICRGKS